MAHAFKLNRESLRREFAVYVVMVHGDQETILYVGKTGDNREGCNPIISRCGNHFSYNKIHSQVRNKINSHEDYEYTYVFDHFGQYSEDANKRKNQVDQINEMERWLNQEIQRICEKHENCAVANPYKGTGHVKKVERKRRESFRTPENQMTIAGIVDAVEKELAKG